MPNNPGRDPFLSAFYLTTSVQLLHLFVFISMLESNLYVTILSGKGIYILLSVILIIINYFYLYKQRRKIIYKYYWKYGNNKISKILAVIFIYGNIVVSGVLFGYFKDLL
jgi:hypothetical protein